jgi:hypothetical protein
MISPFRLALILPSFGVNLAALWIGFRRAGNLDRPRKWLLAYFILCAFTTVGQEILALSRGNNRVLVHLFAPLQLFAFTWMFAAWAPIVLGRIFKGTALAYAVVCVFLLPIENLNRFDGPTFHLQTLLLMGCSMALLFDLALKPEIPLLEHPGAWVASGVLGDMAISLVLYAARDWLLVNAVSWVPGLLITRSLVVTLSYLFYLRALTLEAPGGDK